MENRIKNIISNIKKEAISGKEKEVIQQIKKLITLRRCYDGLEESLEYLEKLYIEIMEVSEARRIRNTIEEICYGGCIIDNIKETLEEHQHEIIKFCSGHEDWFYEIREDVIYLLLQALKKNEDWYDDIKNINNIGWLWEMLFSDDKQAFIVIQPLDRNNTQLSIVCQLLKMLNKEFFLVLPQEQEYSDCQFQQELLFFYKENEQLYAIIEEIIEKHTDNKLAVVLAEGSELTYLSHVNQKEMKIERLMPYYSECFENRIAFGWCGDYLSYLSTLLREDISDDLFAETTTEFSIVIPTRNSVDTLRYTLATCLNQEYQGDYEIVISDNSSNDYDQIRLLCEELNSDKIKYYRTPRNLTINKSFEYAVLKTRGRFVIIIGADDAILPWGLKALSEVVREVEAPIIKWDRGQYIWPGYGKGLDDALIMPSGNYEKDVYHIEEVSRIEYWSNLMVDYSTMYELPNLYLNSGFRREYLQWLYKKTGRIYDGRCNDISLGIINICINERIAYLRYPITIAGNSNNSIGKAYTTCQAWGNNYRGTLCGKESENYIGGLIEDKYDPGITNEPGVFYTCLFYEIRKGIVPPIYVQHLINWRKVIQDMYDALKCDDIYYEHDIQQLYAFAEILGTEIAEWFEENIYKNAFSRKAEPEVPIGMKIYNNYEDENGGYMLDVSQYNVTNIYDVMMICKIASEL